MIIFVKIIGLAALIEAVTATLRIVNHLQSAPIQKKLHWPRIHHSYLGIAILLLYFLFYRRYWFMILGWALVVSDLVHHFVVLPLLRRSQFDIHMHYHETFHLWWRRILGVVLIIVGIGALITPFTPGSWLVIVGMVYLAGKQRTAAIFKRFLGKTIYRTLHIEHLLHALIK